MIYTVERVRKRVTNVLFPTLKKTENTSIFALFFSRRSVIRNSTLRDKYYKLLRTYSKHCDCASKRRRTFSFVGTEKVFLLFVNHKMEFLLFFWMNLRRKNYFNKFAVITFETINKKLEKKNDTFSMYPKLN